MIVSMPHTQKNAPCKYNSINPQKSKEKAGTDLLVETHYLPLALFISTSESCLGPHRTTPRVPTE